MSSPLKIAVIMLHPGCNMTCSFCITENKLSAFTYSQAVALLDALQASSIDNLVFGGGEPFTWTHDLIALTKEAKQRGFIVQIGTNGIDLPSHYLNIRSIDRYVLPLESMHALSHNTMRIYRNEHHEIIIKRLMELREAQKSVTVSTVVTQDNIHELTQLGRYLENYNTYHTLHAWHLYQFIPAGRGGLPNAARLAISPQEYKQVTKEVLDLNLDFTIYRRPDMFDSKTVEFFWLEEGKLQCTGKMAVPDL